MSTENSIFVKVDSPIRNKGEGILDLSFYGYPVELTLPGVCTNARFIRRYSDFESLRNQLCAKHWACIVPPIPEKEKVQDKLNSIKESDSNMLLEYRRMALRRFLVRVSHHMTLGKSPLLASFTDDEEWRQCMRNPISLPAFLGSTFTEGFIKSLQSTSSKGGGVSYNRLLASANADHMSVETWEATANYIDQMENNLRHLRDRFQALANSRRLCGTSLMEFGKVLAPLMDGEEDVALQKVIEAMREHSAMVSGVYIKQSEDEASKVVSTLSYYVGMCAAARQTLSHIQNAFCDVHTLGRRLKEAESALSRADLASREAAQSSLARLADGKVRREQELEQAEHTFQEEFRKFHRENQYDMKELLKVFGELELSYSSNLKEEWESLKPYMEDLVN